LGEVYINLPLNNEGDNGVIDSTVELSINSDVGGGEIGEMNCQCEPTSCEDYNETCDCEDDYEEMCDCEDGSGESSNCVELEQLLQGTVKF